jgi:hypothetical protein
MILPNKVFDCLKWISLIFLPATAVLYGALAPVWGWAYPDEIVYTITAIDTFLGAILGISNMNYKKGETE